MTTIVNMRDRPDLRRQLERGGEHAGPRGRAPPLHSGLR